MHYSDADPVCTNCVVLLVPRTLGPLLRRRLQLGPTSAVTFVYTDMCSLSQTGVLGSNYGECVTANHFLSHLLSMYYREVFDVSLYSSWNRRNHGVYNRILRENLGALDYLAVLSRLHKWIWKTCRFNISICTGSNGDPRVRESLHYMANLDNPNKQNEYQRAIESIGRVLEPYDTNSEIPVYGFVRCFSFDFLQKWSSWFQNLPTLFYWL